MPFQTVHRLCDEATRIIKQTTFVRELVARAVELLNQPMPDTFLGRKTQEPFPKEDEKT